VSALLLDVRLGNDVCWQVKPFAEVVETSGGEGIVVVLPRELSLDVFSRGEGLHCLDDEEVLGVDLRVLWEIVVLLRDEDTLAKEVLVDLFPVGLGNKHFGDWNVNLPDWEV